MAVRWTFSLSASIPPAAVGMACKTAEQQNVVASLYTSPIFTTIVFRLADSSLALQVRTSLSFVSCSGEADVMSDPGENCCSECSRLNFSKKIRNGHPDCVLARLRANVAEIAWLRDVCLLLRVGSIELIQALSSKIDFPTTYPAGLAEAETVERAKLLISLGYEVDTVHSVAIAVLRSERQPYRACREGDLGMISCFAEAGFDWSLAHDSITTCLMDAAKNSRNYTAIAGAIGTSSAATARLLHALGASVDIHPTRKAVANAVLENQEQRMKRSDPLGEWLSWQWSERSSILHGTARLQCQHALHMSLVL